MIRIIPFQRRCLAEPEGGAPRYCGIALALACHKGDSSEKQQNQELGAQTQGAATAGNNNTSNTGTQISTAPSVAGTTIQKGAELNITTDSGAQEDALSELEGALSSAGSIIQNSQDALVSNANQAQQLAAQTEATQAAQAQASTGTFSAWLSGLSPVEIIAGIGGLIAALFLVFGLPKILSKK